ncbi:MAG: hypothetical protein QOG62_811 [Thermoleophilaceae bacterium]|jgi:sugar diacid utilization regulator|nr:hypothetical protein [Thermoleophilaceae bacterium]
MSASPRGRPASAEVPSLEGISELSAAVEAGAGLPEVVRAASRALASSVVVIDSSSSILAVACRSPEDERAVMADGQGAEDVDLRVADVEIGRMRYLPHAEAPSDTLLRMAAMLVAIEADRTRAPERESDAAVRDLLTDVLTRRATDRENIVARGMELGADLSGGGGVIAVRARPQHPEQGDWRGRVMLVVERGARALERSALVARVPLAIAKERADDGRDDDLVVILPGADVDLINRTGHSVLRELEESSPGFALAVSMSRPALDPADLHRAGREALLAANVAEAQGDSLLAFEDTGAYRLLLPAMSEDPLELQRFYDETVAALVAYDDEYETELLRTLETFLDNDGSIANSAEQLFTHRHTIRYRLERARDITGLDVSSSDGRERLSLGLKTMRVLGIAPPHGPATEPGTKGGRVRKDSGD